MAGGRISSTLSSGPAVALTKTVLTVFNFIFWISGIAVLALGIWAKLELYIYMELSTVYNEHAPYILIGVGAVIVLIGSFGCCCTFKGHTVLLYMYGIFLVLVFIVELSAGIAGFVYKNKLETGFREGLGTALKEYSSDAEKLKAFDGLQHNGCYNMVTDFMQKNMALIGGVALGISFFQLIGALLACCLAKNINKTKYEQVQ